MMLEDILKNILEYIVAIFPLEDITVICVPIDAAILGIAYPIIINKISEIGGKYSSQYILTLFKKEFSTSGFQRTIYLTLISLLFLILKLPPLCGWDYWVINNSADISVLALSIALVVFFFIWLDKVALYSGASVALLSYIIKRYNKAKTKEYYLKAINELTLYAIENQNEHLQETSLRFYKEVFWSIRTKHDKKEPLEYPTELYSLVYKLNSLSSDIKNKELGHIEYLAVNGNWLLGGDSENIEISKETYRWLWRNILVICDNPKLIKLFWANSSQYFDIQLQIVYSKISTDSFEIINQGEIDKREKERSKFLEFHCALGGLLLYRKQYSLLKDLFEYSQSQPPNYLLLPETMTEIFDWLDNFINGFESRNTYIDIVYPFPELDNLGIVGQISYWICSYIAILFLRQHSLRQYYTSQNFTELRNLPDDVSKLKNWLANVTYFEKCLNDVLTNHELISALEYEKLIELKRDDFHLFIGNLRKAIQDEIELQKGEEELSEEKIKNFYDKSSEIISKAFDVYSSFFTIYGTDKGENFYSNELKIRINGSATLISKSAFTNSGISHTNYDTFLAESIVRNKVMSAIHNSFEMAGTKKYVLHKDNVIPALHKIIGSNSDIVIIGVNVGRVIGGVLVGSDFKKLIKYIHTTEPSVQDVIFVLRKKDLPAIEYKELKEEEKKELKLINEKYKIYASVIDINTEENKAIKAKWNPGNELDNRELQVQLTISFLNIIHWKHDREVIQIDIASEFKEQGIPNDINDVEPLRNKK